MKAISSLGVRSPCKGAISKRRSLEEEGLLIALRVQVHMFPHLCDFWSLTLVEYFTTVPITEMSQNVIFFNPKNAHNVGTLPPRYISTFLIA